MSISIKRIFVVCVILFSVSVVLRGQNSDTPSDLSKPAKVSDAKSVGNRILLVSLYGDSIIDSDIESIMYDYWKLNDKVQFLSNDMINTIVLNNESKYAILSINMVKATDVSTYGTRINHFLIFSVKLAENLKKERPVYYQDLDFSSTVDKPVVGKGDILFALDVLQNHLAARMLGKEMLGWYSQIQSNKGQLETKTLLIDVKLVDKKLTEEDVPLNYPYKFQFCNNTDIEKAQLNRNKDYATIKIVPMGMGTNVLMHLVIDCENGKLISYGDSFNGAFDTNFSNLINKKHLKMYFKHSN